MSTTIPKSPRFQKTKTKNLDRPYVNEGNANRESLPVDKYQATLMKSKSLKNTAPVK